MPRFTNDEITELKNINDQLDQLGATLKGILKVIDGLSGEAREKQENAIIDNYNKTRRYSQRQAEIIDGASKR